MKKAVLWTIGVVLISVLLLFAAFTSCLYVDFDTCRALPWCDEIYVDSLSGPSGDCQFVWD